RAAAEVLRGSAQPGTSVLRAPETVLHHDPGRPCSLGATDLDPAVTEAPTGASRFARPRGPDACRGLALRTAPRARRHRASRFAVRPTARTRGGRRDNFAYA